ncbi:MAG TPA: hypothetical protein VF711_10975, partial [Acidimicrobiales bacterium]
RLLQAYAVVRRTVDEATAELGKAESDTRPVVEAAADHLAVPSGSVPVVRPDDPSPSPPASEPAPSEPGSRPIPTSRPAAQEPGGARRAAPLRPPPPPPQRETKRLPGESGASPSAAPGSTPSPFGGLGSVTPAGQGGPPSAQEVAQEASPVPPVAMPEPPTGAGVDELFARMRAEQERSGAQDQAANSPTPSSPPAEPGDGSAASSPSSEVAADQAKSDADESVLYRRDEVLDPVDADLVRQLKRVLQDEQNEVLDRLRRQRQPAVEATLPDFVSQTERYQVAAAPLLRTAAHRGAGFVAAATDGPVELAEPSERASEEWAADLAVEIVIPLRERLEAALNEAGDSPADAGPDASIADRLSASYRQWKVQQIEQVARHHTTAAFVRGAFAAAPEGAALRWIVDDEVPCPDCDDNALAGPTTKGQKFPTGQLHPPAHQGCRCVVVTAAPTP